MRKSGGIGERDLEDIGWWVTLSGYEVKKSAAMPPQNPFETNEGAPSNAVGFPLKNAPNRFLFQVKVG